MLADEAIAGDAEIAHMRSALAGAVAQSSHEIIALARALVAVPSAYPPGDTHAIARVRRQRRTLRHAPARNEPRGPRSRRGSGATTRF
jgi:hypothetical protein